MVSLSNQRFLISLNIGFKHALRSKCHRIAYEFIKIKHGI